MKNRQGATLVVVLLVMVVLSIFGLGLLAISMGEHRVALKQERMTQSHYIAYSAANAFAKYIEVNPDAASPTNPSGIVDIKDFLDEIIDDGGESIGSDLPLGEGSSDSYALRVSKDGTSDRRYFVKSTGEYQNSSKTVALVLDELAYFDTAIFAFDSIHMSNGSTADGNGTPFVAGEDITSAGSGNYIGTLYEGTAATPFIDAMEKILQSPAFQFPSESDFLANTDLAVPFILGTDVIDYDGLDLQGKKGIYFGAYSSANQGLTITNNSDEDMYILFDSIDINNANIDVTSPNARTYLYLMGPDVGSGSNTGSLIVNGDINVMPNNKIGNFVIFAGPNVDALRYRTGDSTYSALIFAPNSDVIVSQGTSGYAGSIISENTIFENGADFEYPDDFSGLFGDELDLPTLGFHTTLWN